MSLTVSESGLEIPEKYRNVDKIVIRTPNTTVDLSSGFQMMLDDGFFKMIQPDHFEGNDLENPNLVERQVSIKEYGEEAETFDVTLEDNE